jgi:AraC-like DNA-binding protein
MSTMQSSCETIRVSSGPLPPGSVVRGREGFMRLNMQLDFVNRSRAGQHCSVVAKSFGPLGVGRVHGTPSSFIRARRHFGDGRDLVTICISGGGRFTVEGVRGLDRYAGCGAAVLESRSESALHSLDDSSAWTICMERAPLEPLLAGVQGPLQRCLSGDNPGLRLLAGYLDALFSLDQCDLALATMHVQDLALHALGVSGDVQALVRERGVSAARQRAVLDYVAQHAAEPGLDPARAAERLGMSVRYLHRLLEPTGRSFSEHLLAKRLERAAAMLRDPRFARVRIGTIAEKAGFADISHFNRSFRHAFGDTPFGVRARTARSGAPA